MTPNLTAILRADGGRVVSRHATSKVSAAIRSCDGIVSVAVSIDEGHTICRVELRDTSGALIGVLAEGALVKGRRQYDVAQ